MPVRAVRRWTITSLALFIAFIGAGTAFAGQLHPSVVSEDPVNYTPQLVATTTVSQPHVDAIAQVGNTIFAGGRFEQVLPAGSSTPVLRQNFVTFDALTGQLRSAQGSGYVEPNFNGQIWAIATYGNSIYVGGGFTTVNGSTRPKLVKLNALTGAIDTSFNPRFTAGTVWDLKMWAGPGGTSPTLVVAGSVGKKLMGLNPVTGAQTAYFNLVISDPIPNAPTEVSVQHIAINPAGTKLVATGNFQTVAGTFQNRIRFFMADLSGSTAALDSWYYPGFAKPCASTHPRRIAYLQGVDFSPDGSYFVVTATGQVPLYKADIWPSGSAQYHTVCDAAARFDLTDSQRPVWINYTGGDSVWAVTATGVAVYVQGHFQWLDNPNGHSSMDGGGAVRRLGIGAIHPTTGKALDWNPAKPANMGGKVFLTTTAGLWVGSDSLRFSGENRRGIAFVPLPSP
jgi:Domain of unknown function (DUF5122) beta-propeller